ncbi:armadillo-like helical domain-containing protein 2 [Antechinus flavipes]|uniref:armadillo-like helical domain-containing protein 2 n=1 Tax=Antechinus flavipes TaxID=38775 RepID=UPI0022359215|nr:armadillo-like helical domain-containing protein 2 [Antechinus flavipes]
MAKQNILKRCMAAIFSPIMKICTCFKKLKFANIKEKNVSMDDSMFHKEKIIILGYELKNKILPLEKRALAAYKMGLLAFTGGPMAAKLVAGYINDAAAILEKENVTPRIKILLLQSICSWCYLNIYGQKKARLINMLPILVSLLEDEPSSPQSMKPFLLVKFWSCYLLTIIICNDTEAIQELEKYDSLKYLLQILALENWQGWPENFAEVLFFLMSYYRD